MDTCITCRSVRPKVTQVNVVAANKPANKPANKQGILKKISNFIGKK